MSLKTSSRRTQVRLAPEARRRQIVEQATRLIAASGFNAVSLADIADACDIHKSSVLHYFPTMHELLAAVLRQRDADAYDGGHFPADVHKRSEVKAYFRRVVEHNLQIREVVRLYVMLGGEALDPQHPAHEYFAERNRLTLATLQEMLSWATDPTSAATEFLAFWQGLDALWVAMPSLEYLSAWDSFSNRFFANPQAEPPETKAADRSSAFTERPQ